MTADFNKPTVGSLFSVQPGEIRDNVNAVSKMDYSGAANFQSGAIRFNRTTQVFEEYNGSTWAVVNPASSFSSVTLSPNTGVWTPGSPHEGKRSVLGPLTFMRFRLGGALSSAAATYFYLTASPTIPGISHVVPMTGIDLQSLRPVLAVFVGGTIEIRKYDGTTFAVGNYDFLISGFTVTT